jgi:hypothetical protein
VQEKLKAGFSAVNFGEDDVELGLMQNYFKSFLPVSRDPTENNLRKDQWMELIGILETPNVERVDNNKLFREVRNTYDILFNDDFVHQKQRMLDALRRVSCEFELIPFELRNSSNLGWKNYLEAKFVEMLNSGDLAARVFITDLLPHLTRLTRHHLVLIYCICLVVLKGNAENQGAMKRARIEYLEDGLTMESMEECLKRIDVTPAFWKTLLDCDIPLPVGFLLFRMYLRVKLGSVIFLKRGPETGLLLIQDLGVMFNRDTASFTLRVNIRMTSKAVILNRRNIEEAPGVFIKKYDGGGNTQFFASKDDYENPKASGDFPDKSIYCVAVPYDHKNNFIFTDITGNLDGQICFDSSSERHYSTSDLYTEYWGWKSNEYAFRPERVNEISEWHRVSVAAQASFYKYNPSTTQCDIAVPGVGPLGPDPNPFNQKVVLGGEQQGFTGFGFAHD